MRVETPDWANITPLLDGGAASHLIGVALPAVTLLSTNGVIIDLSALPGRCVTYVYPRTGRPDIANPEGWDGIPGAQGYTPQSCAFRDHAHTLRQLGVDHLFGLSTQDTAYQHEVATRLHLPFPLLSDHELCLTQALRLPTLKVDDMILLRRLTLVIDDGVITHLFYPVFPPDRSADDVIAWLRAEQAA